MGRLAAGRLAIFADLLSHVNLHARCLELMCEIRKLIRMYTSGHWSQVATLVNSFCFNYFHEDKMTFSFEAKGVRGTLQITSSVWHGLSSVFPFLLYKRTVCKTAYFCPKIQIKIYSTLRAKRATFTLWVDQKLIKNAKKWFEVKQCYQTDQFLKGQKLVKMPKFKHSNTTFWVISYIS